MVRNAYRVSWPINIGVLQDSTNNELKNVNFHIFVFLNCNNEIFYNPSWTIRKLDVVQIDRNCCRFLWSFIYSVEFLNSLDLSGILPHSLRLKICSPFIFLRNFNAVKLYNVTRHKKITDKGLKLPHSSPSKCTHRSVNPQHKRVDFHDSTQ